jgi:hypothetical protein
VPASVVPITGGRKGEYVLFEACLPQRPPQNAGVLVIDPATGRGWVRFRSRFDDIADPEDAEVLEGLEDHSRSVIAESGAEAWLRSLEDSCSNALRVSERREVAVDAFTRVLDRLFDQHVEPVTPAHYQTHLPLYPMRVAAGFIGEEMQSVEPEDWVRAPEGMRLDGSLIVVRVVGRSMEPLIPEGSLNIFRLHPVGSRNGKVVLIQRKGVLDDTAGCTVKWYSSVKSNSEDGQWRHDQVRLRPHNHEFPEWDLSPEEFAVIAVWDRVIE